MEEKRPMLGTRDRTEEFLGKVENSGPVKNKRKVVIPKALSKKRRHIARIEKRKRITNKETEHFLKLVNIIKKNIENLKEKVENVRKRQGIVFSAPVVVDKDYEELEKMGDTIYSECYVIQEQVKNLEQDTASQFGSQRKMRCIQKEYLLSQLTQIMNEFRLMQTGYVEKRKRQYRENWIMSTRENNNNKTSEKTMESVVTAVETKPVKQGKSKLMAKFTFKKKKSKTKPSKTDQLEQDVETSHEQCREMGDNSGVELKTFKENNSNDIDEVEKEEAAEALGRNDTSQEDKSSFKGIKSTVTSKLYNSFRRKKAETRVKRSSSEVFEEEEEEEDMDVIFRRYSQTNTETVSVESDSGKGDKSNISAKVSFRKSNSQTNSNDFECHSIQEEENERKMPTKNSDDRRSQEVRELEDGKFTGHEATYGIKRSNSKAGKSKLLSRFSFRKQRADAETVDSKPSQESTEMPQNVIAEDNTPEGIEEIIEDSTLPEVEKIDKKYQENIDSVSDNRDIIPRDSKSKFPIKFPLGRKSSKRNSKDYEGQILSDADKAFDNNIQEGEPAKDTGKYDKNGSETRSQGEPDEYIGFVRTYNEEASKGVKSKLSLRFSFRSKTLTKAKETVLQDNEFKEGNSKPKPVATQTCVIEEKEGSVELSVNTRNGKTLNEIKSKLPFMRRKSRAKSEGEEAQGDLCEVSEQVELVTIHKQNSQKLDLKICEQLAETPEKEKLIQSGSEKSVGNFGTELDLKTTNNKEEPDKVRFKDRLPFRRQKSKSPSETDESRNSLLVDKFENKRMSFTQDSAEMNDTEGMEVTEPLLQMEQSEEVKIETDKSRQELEAIKKREERLKKLEKSMVEMSDLHKEFYSIVHSQGDTMNNIEYYVDNAVFNVEEGREELLKANKENKRYRKRKIVCGIVVAVVIVVAALVILGITVM